MELFGLQLTAGRQTYVPGDVINGEVILQTAKTELIEDLTVSVIGTAHIEWKQLFRKHHKIETYFNVRNTLIGMTSSREERVVIRHVPYAKYFELDIPEGTFPPNFESDLGSVTYDVIVRLRIAKKGTVFVTSSPIRMVVCNHGNEGRCHRDAVAEKSRTVSILPRSSFAQPNCPVQILPHEGDTSLLKLRLACQLQRGTSERMRLIQKTTYHIDVEEVFSRYKLVDCDLEEVDHGDVIGTTLTIPKKKLPIMHHCALISIEYYLHMECSSRFSKWLPLRLQRGARIVFHSD